ncbi:E3 ubiquitin-protein ligase LNX isoform X2 [Pleurodeles waltl]|uniref:E3 ubiquitin-protein ligase LNX isoform X2 n=1 Tax=Pleurodeles waltl TaxID=8319 RepID=UPI0037098B62
MEQNNYVEDMVIGDCPPLCVTCGQLHSLEENHVYTYPEDVDDDLICHICLQALLQPLDTPCGHTYCTICLTNFLIEKDFCPVDRRTVLLQTCKRSNILVHKLLDKLLVTCPFSEHCTEVVPRCDLEQHFKNRCKGASHYGITKEQKRRPEDDPTDDGSPELKVTPLTPELPASVDVLMEDEPVLANPSLSPSTENSQSENSSEDSSRMNRNRHRHFERSTVRSRSFKKLNRAFSVLRRTKSGSAVVNPMNTDRDRERETLQYPNTIDEALPQLYHLIPDGEITNIKINRTEPNESLAIRIVGGSETPLVHIILQHVYRDGAIAKDGRLLPGDMILKVNGIDISNVPHSFALAVLKQPCLVLRLTVLREQRYRCRTNGFSSDPLPTNETLHVALNKGSQDAQLGIKLVRRPDGGVFIFSLQEGGVAARDRQLQENDWVLAINGHDLRHGTPESAALLIQASEETVHFIVSRQSRAPTPDILQEAGWNNNGSPPPCPSERNHSNKNALHTVTCHEKVVNISKDHTESLGMIVAGGVSHREWDLPIYVISVEPDGVISRDGRIKTGDILLSVNGVELTGVSRGEAVALLKNTSSSVVLKALETKEEDVQDDVDSDIFFHDTNQNSPDSSEWSPAWVMWLKLPRYLCSCKEIILRRNTAGSLGFSFVGGYEEHSGNKPFYIKSIVEGTPAYIDGRLRCGDVLLAVNGRSTSGMLHCFLVKMLKELKGRVALAVVSWPGSLL